jgi:acetyl esterase/lipase
MRNRSLWIACGLVLGIVGMAQAQVAPAAAPAAAQPGVRISGGMAWPSNLPAPMPLSPNGAPGALGSSEEDTPTIAAFIPASNPTKTAVVIAPGGGYVQLSMVKEGSDVAAWLNAHGVAAFVLRYRLGPKYHSPI